MKGVLSVDEEVTTSFERVAENMPDKTAIVYLGPIVASAILLLFMVKPLFAPAPEPDRSRVLTPQEQRLLHRFVRRLCLVIGAQPPSEIRVNSQVNASAGFRRGWLGWLTGELVLTIGLPLVAGTSSKAPCC